MSESTPAEPLLSGYIERSQLAHEFHRTVRTLDRLLLRGEGPPFIRVGKKILFRREAVLEWLRSRETPACPKAPEQSLELMAISQLRQREARLREAAAAIYNRFYGYGSWDSVQNALWKELRLALLLDTANKQPF